MDQAGRYLWAQELKAPPAQCEMHTDIFEPRVKIVSDQLLLAWRDPQAMGNSLGATYSE